MVRRIRCLHFILLVFLCFFLISCLPKTGHISLDFDDDVEVDLTRGKLQPGFIYYYSGPEAEPHTIIAIDDDVPFQQNFWQPAQFGKIQVEEWLEAIDNRHRPITDMYSGGRLLDRKGNFLGIWFSRYNFFAGYIDSEGKLVIKRPHRRNNRLRFRQSK
ncbi:MAG: hypothetical protein ABFS09_07470 [Thermodesulfobacteriota bacterium]